MRRVLLVAVAAAIVTGGVVWFSTKSARVQADTEPAGGGVPAVQTPQLPIAQVVLFSSGVGYFQREGVVEDNARIDLSFPVTDINDLLKSMVLRDLNGGHISTVSYDIQCPGRADAEVVRHQPDRQPVPGRHPEPGARRKNRGRDAAAEPSPAPSSASRNNKSSPAKTRPKPRC